jgi:hypothetical protein
MDPQSLTILVGAFQRILGLLIGGALIYFGYRLFLSLAAKHGRENGTGEFSLGGNKIKLSKVGPGVFFAIAGAGLIAFMFAHPMTVKVPVPSKPAAGSGVLATSEFSLAVSIPQTEEDRARMRAESQQDIVALNRALDGENAAGRPELERAVSRAKFALMEPLWAEDWGDIADFRDWLEKGGSPPAKMQPAVDYFQRK